MLITKCITKQLAYGEHHYGVATPYYLALALPCIVWPVGAHIYSPPRECSHWSQFSPNTQVSDRYIQSIEPFSISAWRPPIALWADHCVVVGICYYDLGDRNFATAQYTTIAFHQEYSRYRYLYFTTGTSSGKKEIDKLILMMDQ
jgi:hypothetical protein